jgi:hypothetical protein
MISDFQAGLCVELDGLIGAAHLNDTFGMLLKYRDTSIHADRWTMRCDDGTMRAVKPFNLQVPDQPGLLPLQDEWNTTDVCEMMRGKMLKDCPAISASAGCIEKGEISIHVHQDRSDYEVLAFFTLFLFDTRCFGHTRRIDVRFEEFTRHLLRLGVGLFLKHDHWSMLIANRAAILRAGQDGLPYGHNKSRYF